MFKQLIKNRSWHLFLLACLFFSFIGLCLQVEARAEENLIKDWDAPAGYNWTNTSVIQSGISYQGKDATDATGSTILGSMTYRAVTTSAGMDWIYFRMDPALQPYVKDIQIQNTVVLGIHVGYLRYFDKVLPTSLSKWYGNGVERGPADPYANDGNVWRAIIDYGYISAPGSTPRKRSLITGNWGVFPFDTTEAERHNCRFKIILNKPIDQVIAETGKDTFSLNMRLQGTNDNGTGQIAEETRYSGTALMLGEDVGAGQDNWLPSPAYHNITSVTGGPIMSPTGYMDTNRLAGTDIACVRVEHKLMVAGFSYDVTAAVNKPISYRVKIPLDVLNAIPEGEKIVVWEKYQDADTNHATAIFNRDYPVLVDKSVVNPQTGVFTVTANADLANAANTVYVPDSKSYLNGSASAPFIPSTVVDIPVNTKTYLPVDGYKTMAVASYFFQIKDNKEVMVKNSYADSYINHYGYKVRHMGKAKGGSDYNLLLSEEGPFLAKYGDEVVGENLKKNHAGYQYVGATPTSMTISDTANVITLQYDQLEVDQIEIIGPDQTVYWEGETFKPNNSADYNGLKVKLTYKAMGGQPAVTAEIPYEDFVKHGIRLGGVTNSGVFDLSQPLTTEVTAFKVSVGEGADLKVAEKPLTVNDVQVSAVQELGNLVGRTDKPVAAGTKAVLVDGLTHEPILDETGQVIQVDVNTSGDFTLPLTNVAHGAKVGVKVVDAAGVANYSDPVVVDKLAPVVRDVEVVNEADAPVLYVEATIIDVSKIDQAVIFVGNQAIEAKLLDNGRYGFMIPRDLQPDLDNLIIQAKDQFGNISQNPIEVDPSLEPVAFTLVQAYEGQRSITISEVLPETCTMTVRLLHADGTSVEKVVATSGGGTKVQFAEKLKPGDQIFVIGSQDGYQSASLMMEIIAKPVRT